MLVSQPQKYFEVHLFGKISRQKFMAKPHRQPSVYPRIATLDVSFSPDFQFCKVASASMG
jgi:hypothetical protein